MALTRESLARAARRKARSAQVKVREAEVELVAANGALKEAIPLRDVDALTEAAQRTAQAEDHVREASHELEAVDELLGEGAAAPAPGASGEGLRSLLDHLTGRRK